MFKTFMLRKWNFVVFFILSIYGLLSFATIIDTAQIDDPYDMLKSRKGITISAIHRFESISSICF
jgi:hypothetical protein